MTSIALARTDVIVGVDTHKDQHVAVTVDGLGGRLDELFVPATMRWAARPSRSSWARHWPGWSSAPTRRCGRPLVGPGDFGQVIRYRRCSNYATCCCSM